jgi:hypothetical protein
MVVGSSGIQTVVGDGQIIVSVIDRTYVMGREDGLNLMGWMNIISRCVQNISRQVVTMKSCYANGNTALYHPVITYIETYKYIAS